MMGIVKILDSRFNTQPPEGGWGVRLKTMPLPSGFQHTAA